MAEIKTKVTTASVTDFINSTTEGQKKEDALMLLKIFREITGEEPKMWGSSIIGYGQYHYKSERSSQEGDWMLTGFSPRKAALTLYIMHGNDDSSLLEKLGKFKRGMGCMYINKLSDVDENILKELIKQNFLSMKKNATYMV